MAEHERDYSAVMAQLKKQRQDFEKQKIEFKRVLDQLVVENKRLREDTTTDSTDNNNISKADFNRVLEELIRDREEARKDAREQLAQAHLRELDSKDREEKREKAQREVAREQQQEMAKLYQTMLQQQQNPHAEAIIDNSIPLEVTKKLEEQTKEISTLHQLLKVLQKGAVVNPGQVVPVQNLPSLIAPQEATTTTTTIITRTTPIPTNNSSVVVHPQHSPAPPSTTEITVLPPIMNSQTYQIQQTKDEWQSAAELLYSKRSNSHLKNYEHVTDFLAANPSLFEPLLERCPNIGLIIAHLLKLRLGLTVQNVSWTTSISDWNGEDCRR